MKLNIEDWQVPAEIFYHGTHLQRRVDDYGKVVYETNIYLWSDGSFHDECEFDLSKP